jgi:hypothetical protein
VRSGLGNVLHLDIALPLQEVPGNHKIQLLVQTMQSF